MQLTIFRSLRAITLRITLGAPPSNYRILLLWICMSGIASAADGLTVTEKLIQREIMDRGGDWEGQEEINLVALVGSRFSPSDLEMLSHLRSVRYVYLSDIRATGESLKHIGEVSGIRKLYILDCYKLSDGLANLKPSSLETLEEVRLEHCKLSSPSCDALSRMSHLHTLELLDVHIEDGDILKLSKCESLRRLHICCDSNVPDSVRDKLRRALPNTQIVVSRTDFEVED